METCDTSGWVYDVAVALKFSVLIANPSNEAWRWTKVKRKTDRDDALKLARMADRGDIPPVYMPAPKQRQRPRRAETVVVHLDDPHRFKSVGDVSSYAGLVPKQIDSGTMKRVGKITRRGPSLLRGMLVEVAWMVYRYNKWAKAFVERVSRGIKSRKRIAIVALARKLLVTLWAMLRDETPWRDPDLAAVGNKGDDLAALGRV
jgi:hypothetical protein